MNTLHGNNSNEEILAAISAAIAAIGTREGHNLVVKAIRRVPQSSPVWNTAGRYDRLSNRI